MGSTQLTDGMQQRTKRSLQFPFLHGQSNYLCTTTKRLYSGLSLSNLWSQINHRQGYGNFLDVIGLGRRSRSDTWQDIDSKRLLVNQLEADTLCSGWIEREYEVRGVLFVVNKRFIRS